LRPNPDFGAYPDSGAKELFGFSTLWLVKTPQMGDTTCGFFDYHETFAPTSRVISIRTLLALVAYNDWEVEQLDVVTAFLHDDTEE
jgi:hypothetical protein